MRPEYTSSLNTWQKMRDTLAGEVVVKARTLSQNPTALNGSLTYDSSINQYLRMAQGLRQDVQTGVARFYDYVYRAMYYDFPSTIQSQSLGIIQNRDADFALPTQMEYLLTDATPNREPLSQVLSFTNQEQLSIGRIGLMLEVTTNKTNPYNICTYSGETIVDWEYALSETGDQKPIYVKLLEVIQERQGSEFVNKDQWRILALDENGQYFQYVTDQKNFSPDSLATVPEEMRLYPEVGRQRSEFIPFVCVNVVKNGFDVERPPLEGVADASLKLFQADAEYRNTMYYCSNGTLVTIGLTTEELSNIKLGSGAGFNIGNESGDAKYISQDAGSLQANIANVENLKMYSASLGADLINAGTESGEALNTRLQVKTASLKTLAITGADGLERLLKIGAEWQNLNPEDVVVTPNTDFGVGTITPKDLLDLVATKNAGGITEQELFNIKKRNGYTTAETLDEELSQVEVETVL